MINKKQIDLFEKYAKIRALIEKLEGEEKQVKEKILNTLDKTESSMFGIFTPVTRKTYKYSDKVREMETKAKEEVKTIMEPVTKAKKIEEIDGTAVVTESKTLSFRAIKK